MTKTYSHNTRPHHPRPPAAPVCAAAVAGCLSHFESVSNIIIMNIQHTCVYIQHRNEENIIKLLRICNIVADLYLP